LGKFGEKMPKYTKIVHIDVELQETVEEIQENFRHRSKNKSGGFSWWVRKQIQLFEEGEDIVQMNNDLIRARSAAHRLASLAAEIYSVAYPDKEPLDTSLLYAKAINQHDLREWID
jgi:hypothetical protein